MVPGVDGPMDHAVLVVEEAPGKHSFNIAWLSLCFILETSWVALYSVVCLWVCKGSVTPNQISAFYNIYRHTSPVPPNTKQFQLILTSQYRHILNQNHQVPLIIHHLVRHNSVNGIISLFTTHLMSHAQYTWSSFLLLPEFLDFYLSDKKCQTYLWWEKKKTFVGFTFPYFPVVFWYVSLILTNSP